MASVTLASAEISRYAHNLIDDPSKHLGHLSGYRLIFVKESGWKGKLEYRFGRVSMKSHLQAVALDGRLKDGVEVTCDNSEKLFLFEINQTIWNALASDPDGERLREQHLYHLMLHCLVDDNGLPKTQEPDIRLFTEEIHVWGDSLPRIQALLKRLKAQQSGAGAGLFADIQLDAKQAKTAQHVADRVSNPKRGFVDGTVPEFVTVGEGDAVEHYLPTQWDVENLGAGVRQRFYHAVKVSLEAEDEPAPELPFDKRFVVPGMRVSQITWEGSGKDLRSVTTVFRVREAGFRLLLPIDRDPVLDIPTEAPPAEEPSAAKRTRRRREAAAVVEENGAAAPGQDEDGEAPAGLLEALRDRELLNVSEAERYFVSRYTMNEALRAVGISPTGEMAGLVRAQGYPYAIFCSTEIGGHPVVQAYRVLARDHFSGQTKEYSPTGEPRSGMLLTLVAAEERYEYVIVGEEIYQLELAEVAKDAADADRLEMHPDAAERIANL